jgi:hypothetical protein
MRHLVLVNQVARGFCRLSVRERKHPVPIDKLPPQVAVHASNCACPQHLDVSGSAKGAFKRWLMNASDIAANVGLHPDGVPQVCCSTGKPAKGHGKTLQKGV